MDNVSEWQSVRIGPVENLEECHLRYDEHGLACWRKDVWKIIRVRPIVSITRCQMFEVHPDDIRRLNPLTESSNWVCEHQFLAD